MQRSGGRKLYASIFLVGLQTDVLVEVNVTFLELLDSNVGCLLLIVW